MTARRATSENSPTKRTVRALFWLDIPWCREIGWELGGVSIDESNEKLRTDQL